MGGRGRGGLGRGDGVRKEEGKGGEERAGGPCWEGLQLPLVLANRPLADPGFPGGVPI